MRYALFFITILVTFPLKAENPEKILPRTSIIKSQEWYSRQAGLWKNEVLTDNKNAQAWFNYYAASRYAQVDKQTLDEIIRQMKTAVPVCFESSLAESWNEGITRSGFEGLMKAYSFQPDNPASYGAMTIMHEFNHNAEERKKFSRKLFQSGLISPSLLNYSYNVLMSVERDALLFTDSDNTTLPIWILQDVLETRTDVSVLFLDLLMDEEYRESRLSSLGLSLENNLLSSRQELCALLPVQNQSRKFYYALTVSRENILSLKDQLYVVGLASEHSLKRIDNIALIKQNLENRFLTDYLTVNFNGENEYGAGRVLSSNYLVPMLLLLEHYKASGESEKQSQLEKQVLIIANESGRKTQVDNFLNRGNTLEQPFVPYKLDMKATEGTQKKVKDNVYANEFEVTNKQYNEFLSYLLNNKMTEVYEKSKIQLSQYEEPALSFMQGYHSNRIPTKKEKYFLNYPVVNITYLGAQAYCQWLTDQYNNSPDRKYRKVIFRLPSLDEWQLAAAGVKNAVSWKLDENNIEVKVYEGGQAHSKKVELKMVSLSNEEILYPWFINWNFRNRDLNEKGCALGNFKYPEGQKPCVLNKMNSPDGFLLMSPVQAYFPNNIGLYDVVGNVAEMTSELNKACGGSWNHAPAESTIRSINEYEGSNSHTGFRVFMEVIEN